MQAGARYPVAGSSTKMETRETDEVQALPAM
jgi:hypothetical protein